jgi:hypothetical protein
MLALLQALLLPSLPSLIKLLMNNSLPSTRTVIVMT